MSPRIFFCGEALIDFITTDGSTYRAAPGGCPYSTSKATARAGADAAFCGAISNDLFGQQLSADLAGYGVDVSFAPRVSDPTVLAFIQIKEGRHPAYAFHDRESAMVKMAPALPSGTLRSGDILGIGSISLIVPPGADRIAEFALTQAETATLALDPNVRPALIADHSSWRPRMDRLVARSDIVKISTEDLEFYAPGVSPAEFAKNLLAGGSRLIIVTDGENGAMAWSRSGMAAVEGISAKGGDTVGAGDTLMGFSLAWLAAASATGKADLETLGDEPLSAMLTFANTAAALNCETVGCNPPARDEVLARISPQRQP